MRAKLTRAQLLALLPAAGGTFTFPAPYNSQAVRLTDATTCPSGADCVWHVGYSYWRNINNHAASTSMLIFLGIKGAGPTLLRYHKDTGALDRLGPVFAGTAIDGATGEGMYWSGTRPSTLYVVQGSRLLRFDVTTKAVETVFDASTKWPGTYLWQAHSSDDDSVQSATLRRASDGGVLGCVLYRAATLRLFAPRGDFDECQVDRSGQWLVIKENVDGRNGEDNRIINTSALVEATILDENGAAGHSDLGYGVMVAEDNWNQKPGAVRSWRLGQSPLTGALVYHDAAWKTEGSTHVSHTNAKPDASLNTTACSSTVSRTAYARGSEIFCYRLDGSLQVMVVAPTMADLNAPGGGDDYAKAPKGNLDVTGRYFIWTSNVGSDRLDAFLVKVPGLL